MSRGAGYGMEVPCKYCLYGTRAYVERVQKIICENISHNILHVNLIVRSMSACRGVFVLCNSRWRTYVVSGLRNIEVYAIQGCNKCIVKVSFLGPRDSVLVPLYGVTCM